MNIQRCVQLVAGAALLAGVSACGQKQDTAAPVASASVSFNKARAPLGSPIDIKYRFAVQPGATFPEDCRVFVHFLDNDDELMWTDDHIPPVPASTWTPGQVIEYSRTVFVPVFPYVGQAAVRIGLYSPKTGQRLPLAGQSAGQREYSAATLELLPQYEGILVVYKDGWHAAETTPENPALEWQWTKKESTLSFRNPKQNATFFLHYDGQPAMAGGAQTVTVTLHGELVDTFTLSTPGEAIRRIPLKATQFGTDELVEVRLTVDKTFVPALVGGNSRDPRELGIRVYHAFVDFQ